MRLIDADALKEEIQKELDKADLSEYEACICVTSIYDKTIDNAKTIIWCNQTSDGMPMMDLRGAPKGEWIRTALYGQTCYECFNCHLHYDYITNFCPNCGADMRGNNNEQL